MVYIQVNKLGLLWKELLYMVGHNVVYLEDISDEEAERRITTRGSSADTLRAIRALEHKAPLQGELRDYVAHKFAVPGRPQQGCILTRMREPEVLSVFQ